MRTTQKQSQTHYFVVIALAVALLVFSFNKQNAVAADDRTRRVPLNFIVVLADDLGGRDLGCYGSTFYETPNLDRLARDGMKFTSAYSPCAVCSPSRASLLTGKYPARLHLTSVIQAQAPANTKLQTPDWTRYLPLREVTIAEALQPAGYDSACIGKWHLGGPSGASEKGDYKEGDPKEQGFQVCIGTDEVGQAPDYFFPYTRTERKGITYRLKNLPGGHEGEYLTDRLTDEAERFIAQNKDKPFLLYLPHYAPHTAIGARIQGKAALIAKYKAKAKKGDPQHNPVYAATIESLDESVGRIREELTKLGIADRTVIIFTSDNGGVSEYTSNLPLRSEKGRPYEGGIRVPLMIDWPGVTQPGSVSDIPVTGADLFPTILAMAGVSQDPKNEIDGENLVPLLRRDGTIRRTAVYWHYPHYNGDLEPYSVVRQGDYKLIDFIESSRLELYNLANDIGEKNDLAMQMPEKTRELQALLANWWKSVGAQVPIPNPNYKPRKTQ